MSKCTIDIIWTSLHQNQKEDLQAVFVHGETGGQVWAAGSINWAKAGRHFKLDTCAVQGEEEDCFIWKEFNPSHWYVMGFLYFWS